MKLDSSGKVTKTVERVGRSGDLCLLETGEIAVVYDRSLAAKVQQVSLAGFDAELSERWQRDLDPIDVGLGGGRFQVKSLTGGMIVAGPRRNRPWLSFRGLDGSERASYELGGFSLVREFPVATNGSTVIVAGPTIDRTRTASGKWRNLRKVRLVAEQAPK